MYAVIVDAVVFDVGETLIDETREYGAWADWLGIPRNTFSAVFGAVIALGMDYRDTFQYFRPGFRLDDERARRANAPGARMRPARECARRANAPGARMRASLRRSARMTCTQTRGLAWRHCVTWAYG